MNKIKVSELPDFDVLDSIKTVDDVKDWLEISLQEDKTIEDFRYTMQLLINAIDKNISKMN